MIELRDICKTYGKKRKAKEVLKNINISFRDNELVILDGEAESGKSTLLEVMSGNTLYTSGDIIIDGGSTAKLKKRSWNKIRANKFGYISKNSDLIEHQTVLSNVMMAMAVSDKKSKQSKLIAFEALEKAGLSDIADSYPDKLNKDQIRLVCLVRTLVNEPAVIFADDPGVNVSKSCRRTVVEALKEASKDALVIIATDDDDIKNVGDRIITLADGTVSADSNPFEASYTEPVEEYEYGRAKLHYSTAFRLSWANVWNKKLRLVLLVLSSLIGITGIIFVIAFYNGSNMFIEDFEQKTLSMYPMHISESQPPEIFVTDNETTIITGDETIVTTESTSGDKIQINSTLVTYVSENVKSKDEEESESTKKDEDEEPKNDLKLFKEYLDQDPLNINSQVNSIEYAYDTTPLIFREDEDGASQVYPNSLMGSGDSAVLSTNSTITFGALFQNFYPLPNNPSIYKTGYQIIDGRWPEDKNECVLVLDQDKKMDDTLLYTLGVRNFEEDLITLLDQMASDEKLELPDEDKEVDINTLVGRKFKSISASQKYTYDDELGVWEDNSDDDDFMNELVSKGQELTIVGVVFPSGDDTVVHTLNSGINYTHELLMENINVNANSPIVKAQLENPKVDVLTGEKFEDMKNSKKAIESIDLSNALDIDITRGIDFISFHPEALDFTRAGIGFNMPFSEIKKTIIDSIDDKEVAEIYNNVITFLEREDALQILEDGYKNIIKPASELFDEILSLAATLNYFKYLSEVDPFEEDVLTPEEYFSFRGPGYYFIQNYIEDFYHEIVDEKLVNKILDAVPKVCEALLSYFANKAGTTLTNIFEYYTSDSTPNFIQFHPDKLAEVVKVNLSEQNIIDMYNVISGSVYRTYEDNLKAFGYADINKPLAITIYPKDFKSKKVVNEAIALYNEAQKENGNTDKVIKFSDYAEILVRAAAGIVDVISSALISTLSLFLALTGLLVVFMTYISVHKRRDEIMILNSLGVGRGKISRLFNSENIVLGALIGGIALVLALLLATPINLIVESAIGSPLFILPGWGYPLIVVASATFFMIFGFLPARFTKILKKKTIYR